MPKMNLIESVVHNGRMYGPGEAELPDDPVLLERVNYFEEIARIRNQEALAQGLGVLPAGHPYRQMFPIINSQPAEYEGDPTPLNRAAFQSQMLNTNALMPDGHTVSGEYSPQQFERGQQVPTVLEPNGMPSSQGLQSIAERGTSAGAGESRGPDATAEVQGLRASSSTVPAPGSDPQVASGQPQAPAPIPNAPTASGDEGGSGSGDGDGDGENGPRKRR